MYHQVGCMEVNCKHNQDKLCVYGSKEVNSLFLVRRVDSDDALKSGELICIQYEGREET
jgi:hypothetical protein